MAAEIGERLAKVETVVDGFAKRFDDLRWGMALLATVMLGGFAILGVSIDRRFSSVDRDIDGLRVEVRSLKDDLRAEVGSLRDELRALKSDTDGLGDRVAQQIQRAVDLTLQAYRAGQSDRPAPAAPAGQSQP